jgi:hypothetical protein
MPVVFNYRIADGDTFIANIGSWVVTGGGNELTDYILAFVAERTAERVV